VRALRDGNTECDRPDRASRRNIAFSSNQRIAQSDESSETAIGRGSDEILIIRSLEATGLPRRCLTDGAMSG
jgi:hypothetical protein